MQMEDLTKTQLVLLALLVSVVSSIATGIVTVTLMDQAPSNVIKVLSRVVERKVEVPTENIKTEKQRLSEAAAPIVMKEEDLITAALAKNSKTLVRIYENGEGAGTFVGLGVIIDADGTVITDSSVINSDRMYGGTLFDGSRKLLSLVRYNPKEKTALLQFVQGAEDILAADVGVVAFPAVTFADPALFKIGQTVLMLGGDIHNDAGIGILANMQYAEMDKGTAGGDRSLLVGLGTSIRTDGATGAPLLNIRGELMAVSVIGATNNPGYVPVMAIAAQLREFHTEGIAVYKNTLPAVSGGENAASVSPQ